MLEFETLAKTIYYTIIGILLLILLSRLAYYIKTRQKRISILNEKAIYKYIRFGTILSLPLFIFGLISFVFVLQKANMFISSLSKNLFVLMLCLILATEIFYNIKLSPKKLNRIINIFFLVIFASIGIYLTNLYLAAKAHPDLSESIVIDLPFSGKWIASGAGASGLTNHHDRIASQKYAIDILKFGTNGKLFTGEGVSNHESNTYGSEVISPVKGKVVWVVDTLPDEPIRERDKLAGNHIVIKFQDSLFVALAHLQPNSIPQQVGDSVSKGEPIGKVGMSGNTDFCHLHIHIQNRPEYDIEHGKSYPIRFREFKRKRFLFWENVENNYLLSNDIVIVQSH